jgi:hypothetical protein
MAVDGNYNIDIETPMGKQSAKLTLNSDGDSLSGTLSGSAGEQTLSNGSVTGDDFSFSVTINGPTGEMQLNFKGTVSGDDVSGEVQLGSFGTASFKGTRA